jgi:hypothetical protein
LSAANIQALYVVGNPSTPEAALVTTTPSTPTQTIVIELSDETSGIDDDSVSSADLVIKQDGSPIMPGVDYSFAYDADTDRITLTKLPAGAYFNSGAYEITLNPS